MKVSILPVGEVEEDILQKLSERLSDGGLDVSLLPAEKIPQEAYHRRRKQYRAPAFLKLARKSDGEHVLAVTNVDLYAEPLNFVFGQAEMRGKAAVISLFRLRSRDKDLFLLRALKEILHELGHNRGLKHCPDRRCVMHFSNNLRDTDRKGPGLCLDCGERFQGGPFWSQP
ncbi:MAG: archaemetzincin family Zn-dependent metalloprotease [Thermoplasmata archaeon]